MIQGKPRQLAKTIGTAGVAAQISATAGATWRQAILIGQKAQNADNTTAVFIGTSGATGEQYYEIPVGESVTITLPDGLSLDWYDFYLDVLTNDDGILILYW